MHWVKKCTRMNVIGVVNMQESSKLCQEGHEGYG